LVREVVGRDAVAGNGDSIEAICRNDILLDRVGDAVSVGSNAVSGGAGVDDDSIAAIS
jgi:hypothetical protein